MQHDLRKHHGGEWEVTAGGSALQGENGLEAAIRELKEETGIVIRISFMRVAALHVFGGFTPCLRHILASAVSVYY